MRHATPMADGTWDVDVYTPKNLSPNNVFKAIEKKLGQAEGVLVQADLPEAQISSIVARMWGKSNAQNIKTIFSRGPMDQLFDLIDL
ncbi:hypothetical protein ACM9W9_20585 [Xanthomonas sacchari]